MFGKHAGLPAWLCCWMVPRPGVQRFTASLFKLLGHVGQAATVNTGRAACRLGSKPEQGCRWAVQLPGLSARLLAGSPLEAKLGWGFQPVSLLGVARGSLQLLASAARLPSGVGLEASSAAGQGCEPSS